MLAKAARLMMYDREKSDPAIVGVKLTNKAGQPAAESV